MDPLATHADAAAIVESLSDTERAVCGPLTLSQLRSFLDAWARDRLGSGIAQVRFRAGRIDVVWGVELEDGLAVVIKIYRPPVDVEAVLIANEAQRVLAAAEFPCADPLAGPDEVEGRTLAAETLFEGPAPDGRDPAIRLLLADGLARHIEILRGEAGLLRRTGRGPSWCQYQSGPWPVPHDTFVDFRTTPEGDEWLDAYGQRCADQILTNRAADQIVVGHADWYAGNTAVVDGVLVGTFDWELVADDEAVMAGTRQRRTRPAPRQAAACRRPRRLLRSCADKPRDRFDKLRDRTSRPRLPVCESSSSVAVATSARSWYPASYALATR